MRSARIRLLLTNAVTETSCFQSSTRSGDDSMLWRLKAQAHTGDYLLRRSKWFLYQANRVCCKTLLLCGKYESMSKEAARRFKVRAWYRGNCDLIYTKSRTWCRFLFFSCRSHSDFQIRTAEHENINTLQFWLQAWLTGLEHHKVTISIRYYLKQQNINDSIQTFAPSSFNFD
jgi:hypothetical protein